MVAQLQAVAGEHWSAAGVSCAACGVWGSACGVGSASSQVRAGCWRSGRHAGWLAGLLLLRAELCRGQYPTVQ